MRFKEVDTSKAKWLTEGHELSEKYKKSVFIRENP